MTDKENSADVRGDEGREDGHRCELPPEWRDESVDPDFRGDLGYRAIEWEEISVADDPDQVIFLPDSEQQIKEDAFIVSDTSAVDDLCDRR